MKTPLAYLNGKLVPFAEAVLPLHDAGFVSGATVVDNVRTFRHKLFRWPDHLARFHRDCAARYVPLEATDEQLTATAEELVAHNAKLLPPGGELQLVTFATPGPLGFYLGDSANGPPTLGMVTYPLPLRYRPFFTEGVTLAFAGFQASDFADILPPEVKHRSRLFWHVAEKSLNDPDSQFHNPGAVPAVLSHNGVGDTAIGGILVVTNDAVIRADCGTVLDSISVKVVGELCDSFGVRFDSAPLDMRGLANPEIRSLDPSVTHASEILLAGTGFCLAGVKRFASGNRWRDYSWPGPVFRRLLAAWSDLVGVDIEKQFKTTRSDPMTTLDRYRGALLGLAAGDALGTTLEFTRPGSFQLLTDMVGGGPFGLNPGEWTDDTSMALCLAESLVTRRAFDPVHQLETYVRWYRHGHLSVKGRCFDIGGATRGALDRFIRSGEPFCGDTSPYAAGNGSLMRLVPAPLAFANDATEAIRLAGDSSRTTHAAVECVDACRYFAGLILAALSEMSSREILNNEYEPAVNCWLANPLAPKVEEIARGSFQVRQPPVIRGSGYVIHTLEAALWAFHTTDNFRDGALAVVNLGEDADTTGAVYGQIAGAYYGVEGIPAERREKIAMRELIEQRAAELHAMAFPGAPGA